MIEAPAPRRPRAHQRDGSIVQPYWRTFCALDTRPGQSALIQVNPRTAVRLAVRRLSDFLPPRAHDRARAENHARRHIDRSPGAASQDRARLRLLAVNPSGAWRPARPPASRPDGDPR